MRRGETLEQWRERMADKAAAARGFRERTRAAALSQTKGPRTVARAPRPPKPPRVPGPVNGPAAGTGGRPRTMPEACVECGVSTYRASSPQRRSPGAKRYVARGLCSTCYPRLKKQGRL